jgi:hypothetical protein
MHGLIVARSGGNRPGLIGVKRAMKRSVPGFFVVLLVLAGCAASGGASPPASGAPSVPAASHATPSTPPSDAEGPSGDVEHPTGSDEAIIAVTWAGGMLPVHMQATQTPVFVLSGDGRVIVQGMQTLEFPGPILPALQERTLTEEGIQLVLQALEETGLFVGDLDNRVMQSMFTDANDTIFTVNAGGRTSVATVYAVGMLLPDMEPPPGADPAELEAYQVLSLLHERLLTLETWLPEDAWATDSWQPYQAEALRLYVRDVTDEPIDQDLPGQEVAWPTDDDPATFGEEQPEWGDGTRCAVVEGDAGATWLAALAEANQNTVWTSGDRRYAIQVRPLLPHEPRTCEAGA